jgi:hypothetical protein
VTRSDTGIDLDARYGRTPDRRRRVIFATIAIAVALALAFAAWLVWSGAASGSTGGQAAFEATDTGFIVVNDREVTVTWDFSVDPGTPARCAIQAVSSNYSIIGWKVVDVPASTTRTRQLSETVRTTEPASSGLIYRCWLT